MLLFHDSHKCKILPASILIHSYSSSISLESKRCMKFNHHKLGCVHVCHFIRPGINCSTAFFVSFYLLYCCCGVTVTVTVAVAVFKSGLYIFNHLTYVCEYKFCLFMAMVTQQFIEHTQTICQLLALLMVVDLMFPHFPISFSLPFNTL